MCRLNGEVSGLIDLSADKLDKFFDEEEGNVISLPIKEIIRNLVYEFGEEPYHNIIINDLQEYTVELLEYRYNTPMFIYKSNNNETNYLDNIIIGEDKVCYEDNDEFILKEDFPARLLTPLNEISDPKNFRITFDNDRNTKYAIAKVDYGTVAGYQLTELTYPEESALTANIGEPVTSLLDKIVNVLGGNYEYFYNLDGQFVFQLKESFTKTMWGNKDYVHDKEVYDFTQGAYLISLSNTPDIANLKNDFSIWGETTSGTAIHYRYAIDEKPKIYRSIRENNTIYTINEEIANKYYPNIIGNVIVCDWREILYQMADDYFKCHFEEDFTKRIRDFNPSLFPTGKTKYEQYYRDIQGFWRDLYIDPTRPFENPQPDTEKKPWTELEKSTYYAPNHDNAFWNRDVFENPHKLKFFINFLEDGSIQRFNVRKLGRKPHVNQDNKIKAISYGEVPYLLFIEPGEDQDITGYKKIQMQHIDQIFTKARRAISAKEAMEQCLYKYAYCNEAVNITCSPIFDLQPNSSILLKDKEAQVDGEYIVDKITLSLNYNGNMSITAIKAAEEEVIL